MMNGTDFKTLLGMNGTKRQLEAFARARSGGYPACMERTMRCISCAISDIFDHDVRYFMGLLYRERRPRAEACSMLGYSDAVGRRMQRDGIRYVETNFNRIARLKGLIIPKDIDDACTNVDLEDRQDDE